MLTSEMEVRLSEMSTRWTLLQRARGQHTESRNAQEELLARYRPAVERYLCALLRDSHVAEDLTQEFCLKFVRGDFRQTTPERGRFRDYVKTVLFHLVSGHWRHRPIAPLDHEPSAKEAPAEAPDFDQTWRDELLDRVWAALKKDKPLYHAVLRFHVDHPHLPAVAVAHYVTQETGRLMSGVAARQTLHRARKQFTRMLLDEVRASLDTPTPEQIEDELRELGLWDYCLVRAEVEACSGIENEARAKR